MAHRRELSASPCAAPHQLVVENELPREHQEMHHGVIRHFLSAERRGIGKNHPVTSSRIEVQVIEAVPEGDQTFAAPLQPHLREYARIEAMSLKHGHVNTAQGLREVLAVVAFVT